ncbi:MAG: 30S ribosomal protein S3, partial [Patescibacteria group bacterium]
MGQKIKPYSFRLGITKGWSSRWFSPKNYKQALEEDLVIRTIIKNKISPAGIVRVDIERGTHGAFRIFIKAARPGLIIGRGGKGIEELSKAIELKLIKLFKDNKQQAQKFSLSLNIEELRKNEIAAQNVAQNVAWDLEKRLPARGTMKKHMESVMQNRE